MAIIEQGRLLAVGSVEEISARAEARAEVRLQVLRDAEQVRAWLAARWAHRTVEEVWFIVAGRGRMWRRLGDAEAVVTLEPGEKKKYTPWDAFDWTRSPEATSMKGRPVVVRPLM